MFILIYKISTKTALSLLPRRLYIYQELNPYNTLYILNHKAKVIQQNTDKVGYTLRN